MEETSVVSSKEFEEVKNLLQGLIEKAAEENSYTPLVVLTAQVKLIAISLERITDTVYGNGKLGLITIVNEHSKKLAAYDKITWLVVGIMTTLIIGSIFYLILSHGLIK